MIDSNSPMNSSVTMDDVCNAVKIWGPSKANLKGKTTHAKTAPVMTWADIITPLPLNIYENYKSVTLGMDVMNVNGMPFLVIYGRVVKFGTSSELVNIEKPSIVSAIILVFKIYATRG